MSANLADDVTRDLVEVLEKRRVECCLVSMEGLGETVSSGRLGWGEVTSLWFLSEERGTSGTRRRVLPQDLLQARPTPFRRPQRPAALRWEARQVAEMQVYRVSA